jgi:hypothetical protein
MPELVTLSTIAGTIAVATLAYKSTKSLIELIDGLKNAPRLMLDLKGNVAAVQNVIKSIELMLENRDDRTLPRDLRMCLSAARLPLEQCQAVSDEFGQQLREWCPKSIWDKLILHMQEKKVAAFRMRLKDAQDGLDLSLNVCSMWVK